MGMVRCDANEHSYDTSKYSSCPYCKTARALDEGTVTDYNRNNRNNETVGDPEKVTKKRQGDIDDQPYVVEDTREATVGVWQKKTKPDSSSDDRTLFGEAPVAGWLVVIEGDGVGQDFRIIPGINTIGRGRGNSVMINTGDNAISREAHCIIEFDIKKNDYYLERGSNSTHLNGSRVGGDGTKLNLGDIIEIGNTKLRFVPLCSAEFNWGM